MRIIIIMIIIMTPSGMSASEFDNNKNTKIFVTFLPFFYLTQYSKSNYFHALVKGVFQTNPSKNYNIVNGNKTF